MTDSCCCASPTGRWKNHFLESINTCIGTMHESIKAVKLLSEGSAEMICLPRGSSEITRKSIIYEQRVSTKHPDTTLASVTQTCNACSQAGMFHAWNKSCILLDREEEIHKHSGTCLSCTWRQPSRTTKCKMP